MQTWYSWVVSLVKIGRRMEIMNGMRTSHCPLLRKNISISIKKYISKKEMKCNSPSFRLQIVQKIHRLKTSSEKKNHNFANFSSIFTGFGRFKSWYFVYLKIRLRTSLPFPRAKGQLSFTKLVGVGNHFARGQPAGD